MLHVAMPIEMVIIITESRTESYFKATVATQVAKEIACENKRVFLVQNFFYFNAKSVFSFLFSLRIEIVICAVTLVFIGIEVILSGAMIWTFQR